MMRLLGFVATLAILTGTIFLTAGCGDARTQSPEPAAERPVALGARFNAAAARTLHGRVVWMGDLPAVPAFKIQFNGDSSPALKDARERLNPNAPAIDPRTRGMGGAVVFLRGIDSASSRPWDLPPVAVEIRGRQYHVIQGGSDAHSGFVRKGDAIDMVSKEAECHSLHACGATFFTLSFPDADQPLTRRLGENGVVELSSNAGFFWMRAHLFVTEHPYFVRTDAEGRFELKQVPPGEYELVAWLPNWNVASYDRDPETGFRSRVRFAAAVEVVRKIKIDARTPAEQVLEMRGSAFVP
jgi:hypothetical protein